MECRIAALHGEPIFPLSRALWRSLGRRPRTAVGEEESDWLDETLRVSLSLAGSLAFQCWLWPKMRASRGNSMNLLKQLEK
jgi:hypothetical protein